MQAKPNLTLVPDCHAPEFSPLDLLNEIITMRFNSFSKYAFYFNFDASQARASIKSLLDYLFTKQRVSHDAELVLPHNLYSQFIYILDKGEGIDNLLVHLAEFGPVYKDACSHFDESNIIGSSANDSVDAAKKLLEKHGYLVFNQLNFLSSRN